MNIFDSILVKRPNRSLFNMSHEVKLTGNLGYLYPIFCEEVVPGDTFKISSEVLCRFAPMLAPIMHRVNLKINYHFVPFRLIWKDFEEFITGGEDGTSFPVRPYLNVPKNKMVDWFGIGTLADYLGFPTFSSIQVPDMLDSYQFDALPFRAISLIWNEWYRNQNLQDERPLSLESGEDRVTIGDLSVPIRCWEKDYFTSALPFVQRGEPVKIPIDGGDVEIMKRSSQGDAEDISVVVDRILDIDDEDATAVQTTMWSSGGQRTFVSTPNEGQDIPTGHEVNLYGNVKTDAVARQLKGSISSVNGTINDLRTAYRLQRWLENNARAGSRYIEQILSHFGVKSPDARLQRSEYLGGYTAPVVISEVLQNSQTLDDSGTPQGNMAGHGIVLDKSHYVKRFFPEHGFLIGLLSVIPRTAYMQGLPRKYQRKNRYEFYFPEFANLGEQEVRANEVFFDVEQVAGDVTPFGYQQRFAEMRYIPSTVHGDFKESLAFWHLGRWFDEKPQLNDDFVTCVPRSDIFAVETMEVDKLWIEVYNNVRAVRPLPKYAIPTL